MGEIADMMIDGIMDHNGEFTGYEGYYTDSRPNYIAKVNRCLRGHGIDATTKGISTVQQFVKDKQLTLQQKNPTYGWLCRFVCDRQWKKFVQYLKDNHETFKDTK